MVGVIESIVAMVMVVGGELEMTRLQNESENGTENDHFHKSNSMVQFSKNDHFSLILLPF